MSGQETDVLRVIDATEGLGERDPLHPYVVEVYQSSEDRKHERSGYFRCEAEDHQHAIEQAENAYPDGGVVSANTLDEFEGHVIFCRAEMEVTGGAGFWSDDLGWVPLASATLYTDESRDETQDHMLPVAPRQDGAVEWCTWAEAKEAVAECVIEHAEKINLECCEASEMMGWYWDIQRVRPWMQDDGWLERAGGLMERVQREMEVRRERHGGNPNWRTWVESGSAEDENVRSGVER